MDFSQLRVNRDFSARDEEEHEKITSDAVATFKAYCDHHQSNCIMKVFVPH